MLCVSSGPMSVKHRYAQQQQQQQQYEAKRPTEMSIWIRHSLHVLGSPPDVLRDPSSSSSSSFDQTSTPVLRMKLAVRWRLQAGPKIFS